MVGLNKPIRGWSIISTNKREIKKVVVIMKIREWIEKKKRPKKKAQKEKTK